MRPRPGLAGCVELLLFGAAHRWEELNMEVVIFGIIPHVDRRIVHAHHIREAVAKKAVKHPDGIVDSYAKAVAFLLCKIRRRGIR